jgi:hypothetical protein
VVGFEAVTGLLGGEEAGLAFVSSNLVASIT